MKKVTDILDEAKISYVMLGGAVPNPRLGLVYEGIEPCLPIGVILTLSSTGSEMRTKS